MTLSTYPISSDTSLSIANANKTTERKTRENKIKDFCSYVIMVFIFFIPISTSAANVLAIIIVLLWIVDGNFKEKFTEISHNKVALAILAYVALHVVGLLWTKDMAFGLYTIKKQWKLLLMPVFLGMVKREHTQHYIWTFITAMMFSVFLSYGLWFDLIGEADQARLFSSIGTFSGPNGQILPHSSPTPFNSHVVYNPFLAFAIYLLISQLSLSIKHKCKTTLCSSALLLMTVNMFITYGRTGQIAFIALLLLFVVQHIQKIGYRFLFVGISLAVFIAAYFTVPTFQQRIESTINNAKHSNESSQNSISERLIYLSVSANIIKSTPLIGVGTGDFPSEHKKLVRQLYPTSPFSKNLVYLTSNPHNQYLLTTTQFGIIGLLVFLSIFYQQIKFALTSNDSNIKHVRLALPIFFLVIFLSDSYLQTSTTTLFFSIFSGVFYKNTLTTA